MYSAQAYALADAVDGNLRQEIAREKRRRSDRPVERRLSRTLGHTTLPSRLKEAITG